MVGRFRCHWVLGLFYLEEEEEMYLEEVLYPAYVRNGFGKINKSEIDLYVFHGFLLKELDECYLQLK